MASQDHKPWWELEGKQPPHDAPLDAEREHLRSELARAWRSHLNHCEDAAAPSPRAS